MISTNVTPQNHSRVETPKRPDAQRVVAPSLVLDTAFQHPADNGQVTAAVDRALGATPYPELRQVSVSRSNGTVVLTGIVSSYYLKQLAQTAAMAVDGVKELRNELDVIRGQEHRFQG